MVKLLVYQPHFTHMGIAIYNGGAETWNIGGGTAATHRPDLTGRIHNPFSVLVHEDKCSHPCLEIMQHVLKGSTDVVHRSSKNYKTFKIWEWGWGDDPLQREKEA